MRGLTDWNERGVENAMAARVSRIAGMKQEALRSAAAPRDGGQGRANTADFFRNSQAGACTPDRGGRDLIAEGSSTVAPWSTPAPCGRGGRRGSAPLSRVAREWRRKDL